MSEVKQEEPVKQEGEFKIKKRTPKKLTTPSNEPVKVNIKEPLVELPLDVTKVVIPKQEEDAIQIGETKEVSVEEQSRDSAKVGESVQESNKDVEGFYPIKEITETEKVEAQVEKAIQDERILGKALPENVEKLVSFMEDTGGTVEDYVRLNADYTSVADDVLLKEYYLKTKPYLEKDDVDLLLEDYSYDEDLDEDIDIRKKKLALKEEVAKAKNFLEETKSKYYDEIKLRPSVTQDQKKLQTFSIATRKTRVEQWRNRINLSPQLKNYSMTISKVLILKLEKKSLDTDYKTKMLLLKNNLTLTISLRSS